MTNKKTGASLARHRSKQDIGTPDDFLSAVQRRFGPIVWDLAATAENSVTGLDCYFGPESIHGEDSLVVPWTRAGKRSRGVLWLNPPFGRIDPWAEKCSTMRSRSGWTLLLVPAAVGSNWFQQHVAPNAFVLELQDRVTFVGSTQPYPKDLLLCAFGFDIVGRAPWHWDLSKRKAYERKVSG
jgi:hypothetical protein